MITYEEWIEIRKEREKQMEIWRKLDEERDRKWKHDRAQDDAIRNSEAYENFNTITSTTIQAIRDCYLEYCNMLNFDD